jgi:O-6-methylguanine DNA methyltransferase
LGVFTAHFSDEGLAQLDFPGRIAAPNTKVPERIEGWLALTHAALESVLRGCAPAKLPPLDIRAGTAFQQAVWRALLDIPAGRTKTYGEIARAIGSPNATRAVGSACGANPIPVLIPCHRVLASGGRLGGFSAGLHWKRRLLTIEGVTERQLELATYGDAR